MRKLLSLLVLITSSIFAQNFNFHGAVTNSETGEPLSFASIRIGGTQYGTSANQDGEFLLRLKSGRYEIVSSYIGYRSDTLNVVIPETKHILVELVPQSIILPEVVVSDEDPAYRIIREAIKRKDKNREGLLNFEYDAYTKKIVKSVGDVAIIEETFVKGYNKVGGWEKEFLKSVFRTENIKSQTRSMDFTITDQYFVDFSRDTLSLFMSTVYLPLAQDAFYYYEYKLLKTSISSDKEIYDIAVIPKSSIQPLLEGTITIDSEDYALNGVELSTNEGIRFPYINNLSAEFKQNLNKNYNYWLPQYVEYSASMDVNLQGLIKIGTMEFNQFSNITNYVINSPIPDSVENAQRSQFGFYTADTSKNEKKPILLSEIEIDSLREIPLTQNEIVAFETLDSTKTIDKLVRVEGALSSLIPDNDEKDTTDSAFGKALDYLSSYLEFRNNRVTGLLFGLKFNGDIIKERLLLNAFYGYSFEREMPEGYSEINIKLENFPISDIRFKAYSHSRKWQAFTPYPDIINSLGVSLGAEDHFNYLLAKGFGFGLGKVFKSGLSLFADYTNEFHGSLIQNKYRSIFYGNRFVRPNPEIHGGRDIRGGLSFSLGKNPLEPQIIPENGMVARIDFSSPKINSDFNYNSYRIIGMLKGKTFYRELFVSPYIQLLLDAALLKGNYGPQHILTPITALSFYSPFGSFKGLKPYQFIGTEMVSIHLEHNWRTVPFQTIGLDFISDLHIDIITGISSLRTWNRSGYFLDESYKENDYWEAYLSLSRIFALSRIDFSYSSLKKFTVTASIGVFL